jgi:hypothetical protein
MCLRRNSASSRPILFYSVPKPANWVFSKGTGAACAAQHAITPPVPPGDLVWLCHCSLGLVFC